MTLEQTLTAILDVVAFKVDTNDNNVSILGKAKEDLDKFLTDHTSISDDEKAKRISDFFTNTIISVTTQAIQVAGQAPLQEVQIQTMQDETAQRIESMKVDDKAKLNDSAVRVAKAKAEIETLLPAQVNQIQSDAAYKDILASLESKKIEIADKDIQLKAKQLEESDKKLDLMDQQIQQEGFKQLLTSQQINTETQRVALLKAQTGAVGESLRTNREIERMHDETRLKIAEMQLTSL